MPFLHTALLQSRADRSMLSLLDFLGQMARVEQCNDPDVRTSHVLQAYAEWQEMPGLDVRGKSFLLQDAEGRSHSRQEQQDTPGSCIAPCAWYH